MPEPLTDRQAQVLDAIRDHFAEHGFAPTVRELMTALRISSPNGMQCHLAALEKKGWIKRTGSQARSIQLVGAPAVMSAGDDEVQVTLCGQAFGLSHAEAAKLGRDLVAAARPAAVTGDVPALAGVEEDD